jgi:hypothetical protein
VTLADILAAEEAAFVKGPPCSVALILDQLDATDASVLVTWMANPLKKHTWIADALTKNGHPILDSTVSRHRRGKCGCR